MIVQRRLLYGVLLLLVAWMVLSTIGLFGWFFPVAWVLPVAVAVRHWQDEDEDDYEYDYGYSYKEDWAPEYLQTVDGERLQIIEDDGAPLTHLLAG